MNKKLIDWWAGSSALSSNSYVNSWLLRGQTLGYTLPSASTITALTTMCDSIGSTIMSKMEDFKVFALGNASLSNIATLNFVDPTLYTSTLVNSPTYKTTGFISNGTSSYIKETGLLTNRRSGIENDFSIGAFVKAVSDTASTRTVIGAATEGSSRYILLRPWYFGTNLGQAYGYSVNVDVNVGTGTHEGFHCISSNGGTNLQYFHGTSYTQAFTNTAPAYATTIHLLAWNNSNGGDTPGNYYNHGDLMICWLGYYLTAAQLVTLKTALETYKTTMGL